MEMWRLDSEIDFISRPWHLAEFVEEEALSIDTLIHALPSGQLNNGKFKSGFEKLFVNV